MKPHLVLLVIGMVLAAASARAQQEIPLSLETLGNAQRLIIYAGINGGAAEPYLFDTGSAGFNAAYYNGPYTGPGSNPLNWAATGTVVSNADVYYSDFGYKLNAVYVPSIQIYSKTDLLTPKITLTATSINPGSPGFTIGQVTQRIVTAGSGATDYTNRQGTSYYYDPTFTDNMASGMAPLASGLYGTFGASLFTGLNKTSPDLPAINFVNGSVLGQATTTGWVVAANTGADTATVLLGIDSSIRAQFSGAGSGTAAWTATGSEAYPNSGAIGSTEFGGGEFAFNLSGGANPPVPWTSNTLLDSGTQNNTLNYSGSQGALNAYETFPQAVDAGNTIAITGSAPGSATYSFTTTNGANPVTYNANLSPNGTTSTVGIGFFLNNSVAFDLQNQQTLYTSNLVVPEPASLALLGLSASVLGAVLLADRRPRT